MSIAKHLAIATLAKNMSIAKRLAISGLIAAIIPFAAEAGTFTTLYTFTGKADGKVPYGPLVYHSGEIIGLNVGDDVTDFGKVFEVDSKTGRFRVVYAFQGGADGAEPTALLDRGDAIYGTTAEGGGSGCVLDNHTYGCGTIFSIDRKTHAESVLYTFSQNPNNGFIVPGGLVSEGSVLYGDTENGGANGYGSVFNFNSTSNTFSTLYSFTGGADGRAPSPELLYENGLFYGTTASGGKGCHAFGGCGVVFSIDPSTGAESSLHVFGSKPAGHAPYSNLSYHGGSLYGDTLIGGDPACPRGCGVSFAIKASTGHEKVLETFTNRGESYSGQIIVGGSAYETVPSGGNGNGELLQVNLKTGQQTVLYTFTGGADGGDPQAPLLYYDGAFYGTTDKGNGTVFKYVP